MSATPPGTGQSRTLHGIPELPPLSEFERTVQQHMQYYVRLVERLGPYLLGDPAGQGKRQLETLQCLRQEQGNLLLALDSALERGQVADLLVLAPALRLFLDMVSEFRLLEVSGRRLIAFAAEFKEPELELHGLLAVMQAKLSLYDSQDFDVLADCAGSLAKQLGNQNHLASVLRSIGSNLAMQRLGIQAEVTLKAAIELSEIAEDSNGLAAAFNKLGTTLYDQGRTKEARLPLERARKYSVEVGNLFSLSMCLNNLAGVEQAGGNIVKATQLMQEALDYKMTIGDRRGAALCLSNLANFAMERGELDGAVGFSLEAIDLMQEVGNRFGQAAVLTNLGDVERKRRDYTYGENYIRQAIAIHDDASDKASQAIALRYLALLFYDAGRIVEAMKAIAEALELGHGRVNREEEGILLGLTGLFLEASGNYDTGPRLISFALALESSEQLAYEPELHGLFITHQAVPRVDDRALLSSLDEAFVLALSALDEVHKLDGRAIA